jgi:hypothetical protein
VPDLLDRRKSDLELQLDTLPRELDRWEKLTEQRVFEKHHSQVMAVSRQLRDLNDTVRRSWNGSRDFLAMKKARQNCASVQRIWNYYREKLLMRFDAELGAHLRAADAYVWACYEPVLKSRRSAQPGTAFREPPLIAFDSELSAWVRPRGHEEDSPDVTPGGVLDPTMDALPIAVLGVPWLDAEMLPHLAALAHETGHVVEADFALAAQVEAALKQETKASVLCDGWSVHWRAEIFADLFACWVAGPSFVWTLMDSIPDSPETVKTKRRPSAVESDDAWGKYPPATLRILLNVNALRVLRQEKEADAIELYWRGTYPEHAMREFEGEVATVVSAVYGAARLPESLKYSKLAPFYGYVYDGAVTNRGPLNLSEAYDPRLLIAVASDVSRAPPDGIDELDLWARLQNYIVESRPAGVLAGQLERSAAGAPVRLRTRELADLLFADSSSEGA